MKWIGLAASALVVAACGNPDAAPTSAGAAPVAPSTVSKQSDSKPSEAVKPPADSSSNPRRIYQLKDLDRVTLKANGHSIPAWVMDTDGKREEGMMFLTDKEVEKDEGMIFVFAKPEKQNFWMENTILPLDIIYLSDKGNVVNIQKGKPFDRTGLPSTGLSLYVLEMKQGSSERLGIRAGTRVELPSGLRAKD